MSDNMLHYIVIHKMSDTMLHYVVVHLSSFCTRCQSGAAFMLTG